MAPRHKLILLAGSLEDFGVDSVKDKAIVIIPAVCEGLQGMQVKLEG